MPDSSPTLPGDGAKKHAAFRRLKGSLECGVRVAPGDYADARAFGVGTCDVLVAGAGDAETGREGRAGERLGHTGNLPAVGDQAGGEVSDS